MTHTSGSAHLRLANTDVLVGVKAVMEPPSMESPNEGNYETSKELILVSSKVGEKCCRVIQTRPSDALEIVIKRHEAMADKLSLWDMVGS